MCQGNESSDLIMQFLGEIGPQELGLLKSGSVLSKWVHFIALSCFGETAKIWIDFSLF